MLKRTELEFNIRDFKKMKMKRPDPTRYARALALRRQGLTYKQIGERMPRSMYVHNHIGLPMTEQSATYLVKKGEECERNNKD